MYRPAAIAILVGALALLATRRAEGPPPVDDLDRRLFLEVVDEQGDPVANAELGVSLTRIDLGFIEAGDHLGGTSASVATDARGWARAPLHDEEGRCLLEVAASDRRFCCDPEEVDVEAGRHAAARVVARPAIRVEVRVVDAEGRPLEGAVVDVAHERRQATDASGVAVFGGLPPRVQRGEVRVWDARTDAYRRRAYALDGSSAVVAVQLPPGGPVTYEGRVEKALAAAAAEVPPPLADVPPPITAGAISLDWPPLAGPAPPREEPPAVSFGVDGAVVESVPRDERVPDIGLLARDEAGLLVRVRDGAGAEVSPACLFARSGGGPWRRVPERGGWFFSEESLDLPPPVHSPTALRLRTGEWELLALSPAHGPGPARRLRLRAGERALVDLRAGPRATAWIEGRLDAPEREVRGFQAAVIDDRLGDAIVAVASIDMDGRFLVGPLAAGVPLRVEVVSADYGLSTIGGVPQRLADFDPIAPRAEVTLAPGETRALALALPRPATVDVVAAPGEPGRGEDPLVSLRREGSSWLVTQVQLERRPSSGLPEGLGRARLRVEPGRYRLTVGAPAAPEGEARFDIPLTLAAGASVTISAAPSYGDAELSLALPEASPSEDDTPPVLRGPGVSFRLDVARETRLTRLPPGRYRLERHGCLPLELTLAPGERRTLGEIRLRPR